MGRARGLTDALARLVPSAELLPRKLVAPLSALLLCAVGAGDTSTSRARSVAAPRSSFVCR